MSRRLSDITNFTSRLDVGKYGKSKVLDVTIKEMTSKKGNDLTILELLVEILEPGLSGAEEHTVGYILNFYPKSTGGEFSPGFSALKRDAESLGILGKLSDELPDLDNGEIVAEVKRAFKGVFFRFDIVPPKPRKNAKEGDAVFNETILKPLTTAGTGTTKSGSSLV